MSEFIFQQERADVTGDGTLDTITLRGSRENPQDIFIRNINLTVTDGRTNQIMPVTFANNAGYNPRFFLGDFDRTGVPDVLLSIDSGGSGGFAFYYVYSFLNNIPTNLFDNDMFNQTYRYTVTFEEGCRVSVYNQYLNKTYYIDVRAKKNDIYADVYGPDCRLLTPTSGNVFGLNSLFPLTATPPGNYDLLAIQRVTGLYNADSLGNLETSLTWNGTTFVPFREILTTTP